MVMALQRLARPFRMRTMFVILYNKYQHQLFGSSLVTQSCSSINYHRTNSFVTNTLYNLATRQQSTLSRRSVAALEDLLGSKVAKSVYDPVLSHLTLHQLGWVHKRIAVSNDSTTFTVLLKLPSLLHPHLDELKTRVQHACQAEFKSYLQEQQSAEKVPPVFNVDVQVLANKPVPIMARLAEEPEELLKNLGPGLNQVAHYVAVYSCKGGVGKSTVAVNLAYELARKGGRVGILDLDLYGPSLPILVRPDDLAIRQSPLGSGLVYPIQHHGVKLLSLGFVSKNSGVPGSGSDNGAAIMRGAMVIKVVNQLLKGTDWGELDVLVLDLPPGTGDTQLAVLQDLQISGAVAVTTPSKLALADTKKGIEMFTGLGVPTMSVVENMSFFVCDGGKKHYPFGPGLVAQSGDEFSLPSNIGKDKIMQLPLSPTTNDAIESGQPLCLVRPAKSSDELAAFSKLADIVSTELLKLQYGHNDGKMLVEFADHTGPFDTESLTVAINRSEEQTCLTVRLISDTGAVQKNVSGSMLRATNPKTGELHRDSHFLSDTDTNAAQQADNNRDTMIKITKASRKVNPSTIPSKVQRKGRYGFAIEWGDGATIIYSNLALAKCIGGTQYQDM